MLVGEFEGYQKTMVPVDQQDIDLILDVLRLSQTYIEASWEEFNLKDNFFSNKHLYTKIKYQVQNDLDLIRKCQALLNKK